MKPFHGCTNFKIFLLCCLGLAGCATTSVQPWEKGNLAKKEMALQGDVLDEKFIDHVYTSKEASSGGKGVGGGGCGCN